MTHQATAPNILGVRHNSGAKIATTNTARSNPHVSMTFKPASHGRHHLVVGTAAIDRTGTYRTSIDFTRR